MSPSHPRRSLRLLAPVLVTALVAACSTPPKLPPGADNPGLASHGLESANPLDIAVLRIENQTGQGNLPLEAMRKHFHVGLVERHYSPLSLEYVDGQAVEASYTPGASGESALLKVVLTGWDDHLWKTHSRLVIDADVWLLDAANPTPERALWGGHVSRTLDLGRVREMVAGETQLLDRAASDFARQVLASLPARRPEMASSR